MEASRKGYNYYKVKGDRTTWPRVEKGRSKMREGWGTCSKSLIQLSQELQPEALSTEN